MSGSPYLCGFFANTYCLTGWNCCKPRVLTFDEFLTIPPCTTGKHSTVDDTPAPEPKEVAIETAPAPKPVATNASARAAKAAPLLPAAPAAPQPPEPESEDDDEAITILPNTTCRRRACGVSSTESTASSREGEKCVYHPGHPIFHEGSKGWTCCKKRVLEFDEFMRIGGCKEKERHMFVGSGKKGGGASGGEKMLDTVR